MSRTNRQKAKVAVFSKSDTQIMFPKELFQAEKRFSPTLKRRCSISKRIRATILFQNQHSTELTNMKLILTLAALATLAFNVQAADEKKPDAPAAGAEKPKHDPEASFKKTDTNSDGSVSLDEFKATKQAQKDVTKAEATFQRKDKDKDGKLTLDEYKAGGGAKKDGAKKEETK